MELEMATYSSIFVWKIHRQSILLLAKLQQKSDFVYKLVCFNGIILLFWQNYLEINFLFYKVLCIVV